MTLGIRLLGGADLLATWAGLVGGILVLLLAILGAKVLESQLKASPSLSAVSPPTPAHHISLTHVPGHGGRDPTSGECPLERQRKLTATEVGRKDERDSSPPAPSPHSAHSCQSASMGPDRTAGVGGDICLTQRAQARSPATPKVLRAQPGVTPESRVIPEIPGLGPQTI